MNQLSARAGPQRLQGEKILTSADEILQLMAGKYELLLMSFSKYIIMMYIQMLRQLETVMEHRLTTWCKKKRPTFSESLLQSYTACVCVRQRFKVWFSLQRQFNVCVELTKSRLCQS